MLQGHEVKNRKYHTLATVLKSNRKIVERGKIDTPNTQTHDSTHCPGMAQALSIKSGGVKLVL